VKHLRNINNEIRRLTVLPQEQLMTVAKELGAPYELVQWVAREGKLPVPNFAAGGVATPADAALMMQLGAETVFVGSGVFKSENPVGFARAIVKAVAQFNDPQALLEASRGLGHAMRGQSARVLPNEELMSPRGW
jgi:pyridoxal 5'-phosphate synthase pdxS subunit